MSELMTFLNQALSVIDGLVTGLFEMKPQVLFVVLLYGLGMTLNHTKKFPGGLIPPIIMLLGTFGLRWFIPDGTLVWNVQAQEVITAGVGLAVGMAVVMFYDYIGKYLETKVIGWMKKLFGIKDENPAQTIPDSASEGK